MDEHDDEESDGLTDAEPLVPTGELRENTCACGASVVDREWRMLNGPPRPRWAPFQHDAPGGAPCDFGERDLDPHPDDGVPGLTRPMLREIVRRCLPGDIDPELQAMALSLHRSCNYDVDLVRAAEYADDLRSVADGTARDRFHRPAPPRVRVEYAEALAKLRSPRELPGALRVVVATPARVYVVDLEDWR